MNIPGIPPRACNRSLWPSEASLPPASDRLWDVTLYWWVSIEESGFRPWVPRGVVRSEDEEEEGWDLGGL